MLKSIRMAFVIFSFVLISAQPVGASPKVSADVREAIIIPPPPAGKGQIVFFRPFAMGAAYGCSVKESGGKLSSLGANRYFILVADSGRHEYFVENEAKDSLVLELEPDETQFVRCRMKNGILLMRPDLQPSSEGEFRKSNKWKMVDDDDMGPGPGALRKADVAAALAPKPTPAPEPAPAPAPASAAEPAPAPTN